MNCVCGAVCVCVCVICVYGLYVRFVCLCVCMCVTCACVRGVCVCVCVFGVWWGAVNVEEANPCRRLGRGEVALLTSASDKAATEQRK